ncbi:hypothetical protein L9F63_027031, partial [Diploptera punctata]
ATRAVQEDKIPTLNGLVMGIVGIVLVALVILTVCLWKRKEMSKCVARNGKSRKSSCS